MKHNWEIDFMVDFLEEFISFFLWWNEKKPNVWEAELLLDLLLMFSLFLVLFPLSRRGKTKVVLLVWGSGPTKTWSGPELTADSCENLDWSSSPTCRYRCALPWQHHTKVERHQQSHSNSTKQTTVLCPPRWLNRDSSTQWGLALDPTSNTQRPRPFLPRSL